jgi:hypothetical protein
LPPDFGVETVATALPRGFCPNSDKLGINIAVKNITQMILRPIFLFIDNPQAEARLKGKAKAHREKYQEKVDV